jgi:uncharacterized protein YbjT (DUF2867 family)
MRGCETVLVTGATGNQGGAVTHALLGAGHQVRALTRHPGSAAAAALAREGAQLAAGDFGDPAALRAACRGADGVFLMSTPFEAGTDAEVRQAAAVLDAAVAAGVGQVVFSSVASADRATGIGHFESKLRIEQSVQALGLLWTILCPVSFMDGFASDWMRRGLGEGRFVFPAPAAKTVQVVALADLAAVATLAFEQPGRFAGRRLEIAGDELTGPQMAQVLSEATGRPIAHMAPPLESLGLDPAGDQAALMRWLARTGYSVDLAELHADIPEVAWHTFAAWAGTISWGVPR